MVKTSRHSREEIAKAVTELLNLLGGGDSPENPDEGVGVLELWGLDSEHGVELACDLSVRLDIEIPKAENPLIDESSATGRKRSRTLAEVVDYLVRIEEKENR